MKTEFAILERYLNNWFLNHRGVGANDLWYFEMIHTLNDYDLLNTILCIYIRNAENNNLDMNYDNVFSYILTRVRTRTLGNTLLEWQSYVQETIDYYGCSYEKMMESFINFLQEYGKTKNKLVLYQSFITELLNILEGIKEEETPIKNFLKRCLKKFRKEN